MDPKLGVLDGVVIEWREGRFTRVEQAARPPADYPAEICFPDHLLTPGLLNAHAHLDYSFLKGVLPRGRGFAVWLRAMIEARRSLQTAQGGMNEESISQACRRAIGEMIEDGVTEVWDISSPGWAEGELKASGMRAISFREWLAPNRSRWEAQWASWREDFESRWPDPEAWDDGNVRPGVSAHAPYTLCPAALEASARWARQRGLPMAIHLAESPEENELLMAGRGALRDLLLEVSAVDPGLELGIGRSAIQRAVEAGVVGLETLAVHCNLPSPGEARVLAESGATVVFCPRSHAFFGYPPYPLEIYREAGVRLTLGTDSLASNDGLSIRDEARALTALAQNWRPLEILACATGALIEKRSALGGRGRLAQEAAAQWALWRLEEVPGKATPERMVELWLSIITRLEASSANLEYRKRAQ
jgi:cytosine/adenosine deaminase-related metal-dependent hydrolase